LPLGRRAFAGGLLASAALASPASALGKLLAVPPRPVENFTLSNGLQVVVLPSRRAPIVNQLLVYRIGSADEVAGQTGVAHFLEHMMFKGTGTVPPGEFSRLISRTGGRDNAFTDFDMTGYHQTVAADRLELVMRLEADRMANLAISERELVPERQVVLEERRMRIENSPAALLDEAVRELLFGRHNPYGMLTSGVPDDVRRLGVAQLAAFYRRYYAPNNAVLIVAGDTTAGAVSRLAEKYYGAVAKRPVEPRRRPSEGGQGLPRRVQRADARVAESRWSRDYLAPSYRTGEVRHAYALTVLAHLLGGSETSRLSQALVADGKLALSASAGYRPGTLGLSAFDLSAQLAPGKAMADLENAVSDQMKKLLDSGVTSDEVERSQNQLLAAAIYSQDSLASGPRSYGSRLGIGGTVADVNAWPQRIAAVTPDDVVAAARHVWRDDRMVTSLLTPAEGTQ
jgi:zinc protease